VASQKIKTASMTDNSSNKYKNPMKQANILKLRQPHGWGNERVVGDINLK
jgi:hypothetical protein